MVERQTLNQVVMGFNPTGRDTKTTYSTGPSCSKLTTSLVNVSLKFQTLILQIHCYLLLYLLL